jgi:hypothetical protein
VVESSHEVFSGQTANRSRGKEGLSQMDYVGQRVKITAISKRAKDRVQQHGEYMILVRANQGKVLLRSERKTWRGEFWMGWFENGSEVKIEGAGPLHTS